MAVILDTNLLVLLVVGAASREYIAVHKRLSAYTAEDYTLLVAMLSRVDRVVVTPNTLSETSNLIRHIPDPARTHICRVFQRFIGASGTTERYVGSKTAAEGVAFIRLGLTDSVLLEASNPDDVLLTTDLDLYLAASRQGLRAENFNHHRNL